MARGENPKVFCFLYGDMCEKSEKKKNEKKYHLRFCMARGENPKVFCMETGLKKVKKKKSEKKYHLRFCMARGENPKATFDGPCCPLR
jgi:hypothetical protein